VEYINRLYAVYLCH